MWPFTRKTKPEPPPTKAEPLEEATNTELIAAFIELREEWKAFLDMQARISRRTGAREKREPAAPEPDISPTTDKAAIRALARQKGMIR